METARTGAISNTQLGTCCTEIVRVTKQLPGGDVGLIFFHVLFLVQNIYVAGDGNREGEVHVGETKRRIKL